MKLKSKNLSHAKFTVAMLVAFSSAATAANVVISVTGTPTSEDYGYVYPGPYTFNFTVNGGFTNTGSSVFLTTRNYWSEELVSDPILFTDVSGDGMTGAWQRPILNDGDPWSSIETRTFTPQPELCLTVANDGGYPLGMQLGGFDVLLVDVVARIGDIFSFPESYVSPTDYLASLAGTHAASGGFLSIHTVDPQVMGFAIDSVTISVVPEPAYAALLTGLGLAILLIYRRRNRFI